MKKVMIAALILASLLSACAVVPGRHGDLVVVPLLPPLVVLDAEPFYFHGGFYYHYNNNAWFYSRSRSGPWVDLPRDHYPKEVRYKGSEGRRDHDDRDHGRDRDHDRGDRDRDRDHDNRRR